MFGFHWPELALVLGAALLLFGPKRLPEMGSSIARTIKEFQGVMRETRAPQRTAVEPATSAPALPATAECAGAPKLAAPLREPSDA